ncbi:uncharacterized protein LOC144744838 [Ciona intestinalis]
MGYWIGGYCSDNCMVGDGGLVSNQVNWKWGDGSGMYNKYTNWYSTLEPNGGSNQGAHVYNFHSMAGFSNTFGAWGDDSVNSLKNYICQRDNHCYPNPCHNGGTCQNTPAGSFTCHCPPGFGVPYCRTDYCNPCPCQNGGTCIGTDGYYRCDCQVGIVGTDCDTDLCRSNPCQNGGTCIGTDGGYDCNCQGGYNGTYCTTDLCDFKTCQNGGTCQNTGDAINCNCIAGFHGNDCENTPCTSNPCQNMGSCSINPPGYICKCGDGYSGTDCETDICDLEICQNEGTCYHAAVTGFVCECKKGYNGTTCQIGNVTLTIIKAVNTDVFYPCFNRTCENNGMCYISNYTSLCNCKDGYEGDNCELIIGESVDNIWIPIVAGTLGGVALLVIIAVIVYCCVKKKSHALN